MKNFLLAISFAILVSGCASMSIPGNKMTGDWCTGSFMECIEDPQQVELPTYKQLRQLPPAEQQPVVAVYNFGDLTGQRKEGDAPLYLSLIHI